MASRTNEHLQGEVWDFNPDPVVGNEVGYKIRPCVILSHNLLNEGPSGLVIIVPCTSRDKRIHSHVKIEPPEGGLKKETFVMCEQIRTISKQRLILRRGQISYLTLKRISDWIADLMRI